MSRNIQESTHLLVAGVEGVFHWEASLKHMKTNTRERGLLVCDAARFFIPRKNLKNTNRDVISKYIKLQSHKMFRVDGKNVILVVYVNPLQTRSRSRHGPNILYSLFWPLLEQLLLSYKMTCNSFYAAHYTK